MIAEQSKPHSSVAKGTQLDLAGRPMIFDDFEFLAVLAGSRSSSPALKNEPNKSWRRAEAFLTGGEKSKHEQLQSGSWQTFGGDWKHSGETENIGRLNEP